MHCFHRRIRSNIFFSIPSIGQRFVLLFEMILHVFCDKIVVNNFANTRTLCGVRNIGNGVKKPPLQMTNDLINFSANSFREMRWLATHAREQRTHVIGVWNNDRRFRCEVGERSTQQSCALLFFFFFSFFSFPPCLCYKLLVYQFFFNFQTTFFYSVLFIFF